MRTSCVAVLVLAVGTVFAGCIGNGAKPSPAAKAGVQTPPAASVSSVDNYKQMLDKPVTVNAAQSSGGERLTVQYAAIAICKAAGVPYQWDKSASRAGDACRRFIAPLNVNGIPAKQALTDMLAPLGVRFEVDENGIYLSK